MKQKLLNRVAAAALVIGAGALVWLDADSTNAAGLKRTSINPTAWGAAYQMDQAVVVENVTRTLYASGQTAMIEDPAAEMGLGLGDATEMRSQLAVTLKALDDVLAGADMARSNIVHLTFYTTDEAAFLEAYDVYAEWISSSGVMPPQTLVKVAGLVIPGLLIEIDMTAAD